MPREIHGTFTGAGRRIAIAAARFNGAIVESLVSGAVDALIRHGVADKDLTIARVPGAWELPLLVKKLLSAKQKPHAVIALGCVIRGETPHFDYVAGECAKGLANLSLAFDVPVLFGVLTTDTTDQAWARAGLKAGNKGVDAAMAALECISVLEQV